MAKANIENVYGVALPVVTLNKGKPTQRRYVDIRSIVPYLTLKAGSDGFSKYMVKVTCHLCGYDTCQCYKLQ